MSLRVLVDCGNSSNFVRRQSVEGCRLKFVSRDIPLTKIEVLLATGASINVEKHVVGIHYTLEGEHNEANSELAASIREDACHLLIRRPSDERLRASKIVWMYCE